jgi:outer membrane receptor for ferrienterochelin and colicin
LWGIDTPASGGVFDRTNLTETAQGSFRLHTRPAAGQDEPGASVSTVRDDNKFVNELRTDRGKAEFKINGSYTLFRDQLLYDQRNDTALDHYENTRENTYVLHAQAATPLFSLGQLTIGSEGIFENLNTPRTQPNTTNRHRIAGYSQFDTRVFESLILSPGIRYDRDSQFGDYVSPRFGAKIGNDDIIIRASAGIGYRSPSFRELYLYFDNPSAGYTVQGNSMLRQKFRAAPILASSGLQRNASASTAMAITMTSKT